MGCGTSTLQHNDVARTHRDDLDSSYCSSRSSAVSLIAGGTGPAAEESSMLPPAPPSPQPQHHHHNHQRERKNSFSVSPPQPLHTQPTGGGDGGDGATIVPSGGSQLSSPNGDLLFPRGSGGGGGANLNSSPAAAAVLTTAQKLHTPRTPPQRPANHQQVVHSSSDSGSPVVMMRRRRSSCEMRSGNEGFVPPQESSFASPIPTPPSTPNLRPAGTTPRSGRKAGTLRTGGASPRRRAHPPLTPAPHSSDSDMMSGGSSNGVASNASPRHPSQQNKQQRPRRVVASAISPPPPTPASLFLPPHPPHPSDDTSSLRSPVCPLHTPPSQQGRQRGVVQQSDNDEELVVYDDDDDDVDEEGETLQNLSFDIPMSSQALSLPTGGGSFRRHSSPQEPQRCGPKGDEPLRAQQQLLARSPLPPPTFALSQFPVANSEWDHLAATVGATPTTAAAGRGGRRDGRSNHNEDSPSAHRYGGGRNGNLDEGMEEDVAGAPSSDVAAVPFASAYQFESTLELPSMEELHHSAPLLPGWASQAGVRGVLGLRFGASRSSNRRGGGSSTGSAGATPGNRTPAPSSVSSHASLSPLPPVSTSAPPVGSSNYNPSSLLHPHRTSHSHLGSSFPDDCAHLTSASHRSPVGGGTLGITASSSASAPMNLHNDFGSMNSSRRASVSVSFHENVFVMDQMDGTGDDDDTTGLEGEEEEDGFVRMDFLSSPSSAACVTVPSLLKASSVAKEESEPLLPPHAPQADDEEEVEDDQGPPLRKAGTPSVNPLSSPPPILMLPPPPPTAAAAATAQCSSPPAADEEEEDPSPSMTAFVRSSSSGCGEQEKPLLTRLETMNSESQNQPQANHRLSAESSVRESFDDDEYDDEEMTKAKGHRCSVDRTTSAVLVSRTTFPSTARPSRRDLPKGLTLDGALPTTIPPPPPPLSFSSPQARGSGSSRRHPHSSSSCPPLHGNVTPNVAASSFDLPSSANESWEQQANSFNDDPSSRTTTTSTTAGPIHSGSSSSNPHPSHPHTSHHQQQQEIEGSGNDRMMGSGGSTSTGGGGVALLSSSLRVVQLRPLVQPSVPYFAQRARPNKQR